MTFLRIQAAKPVTTEEGTVHPRVHRLQSQDILSLMKEGLLNKPS